MPFALVILTLLTEIHNNTNIGCSLMYYIFPWAFDIGLNDTYTQREYLIVDYTFSKRLNKSIRDTECGGASEISVTLRGDVAEYYRMSHYVVRD